MTGLPDTGPDQSELTLILRKLTIAAQAGDHGLAVELASSALSAGLQHPALYHTRAVAYARREMFDEALSDFQAALAGGPQNPFLLEAAGHCLSMLNRLDEALAAFDAAIAVQPGLARAHYRKGSVLGMLNRPDEMRLAHEYVVALEPDNADALASLAFLSARAGDMLKAQEYASKALLRAPRHPVATIALAFVDMSRSDFPAAARKIDDVLRRPQSATDGQLNIVLGFAADALHQHGRPSEAFELYTRVNERRRRAQAPRFGENRAMADTRRLSESFSQVSWPLPSPVLASARNPALHVFLVGFVRSGTTLLETILAMHGEIAVADEHDFLAEPASRFLQDEDGLARLSVLDEDTVADWREDYWTRVSASCGEAAKRVFVDKLPLNSLRLPLIAKFFPESKVILTIRDPRDVVLSTFRRRFNPSASAFEFLGLEDCAQYYAEVMRFVDICRSKLPLDILEHRYEDLLADFDSVVRAVCEFIGVQWNPAMRDFAAAAGTIDPRSQSAPQVRRGLYHGGSGQWLQYREQLAPVMPILRHWIERFGYSSQ